MHLPFNASRNILQSLAQSPLAYIIVHYLQQYTCLFVNCVEYQNPKASQSNGLYAPWTWVVTRSTLNSLELYLLQNMHHKISGSTFLGHENGKSLRLMRCTITLCRLYIFNLKNNGESQFFKHCPYGITTSIHCRYKRWFRSTNFFLGLKDIVILISWKVRHWVSSQNKVVILSMEKICPSNHNPCILTIESW